MAALCMKLRSERVANCVTATKLAPAFRQPAMNSGHSVRCADPSLLQIYIIDSEFEINGFRQIWSESSRRRSNLRCAALRSPAVWRATRSRQCNQLGKILESVTSRVDQARHRSNFRCKDMNHNINVILSSWRREKKRKNIEVRDLTPVKDAKGGGTPGPGHRPAQKRGDQ